MQNVTSKLQIGLSPEMGWYHVSYYYRKKMSGCVHQVAVHEHCSKTVLRPLFLAYTPGVLRVFCSDGFPYVIAPAFSTPAFSTPAFSAPPQVRLPHGTAGATTLGKLFTPLCLSSSSRGWHSCKNREGNGRLGKKRRWALHPSQSCRTAMLTKG